MHVLSPWALWQELETRNRAWAAGWAGVLNGLFTLHALHLWHPLPWSTLGPPNRLSRLECYHLLLICVAINTWSPLGFALVPGSCGASVVSKQRLLASGDVFSGIGLLYILECSVRHGARSMHHVARTSTVLILECRIGLKTGTRNSSLCIVECCRFVRKRVKCIFGSSTQCKCMKLLYLPA